MAAGPPPAAKKSSNSKLLLWIGALVALLAVTGGLAYVAFQRFVSESGRDVAQSESSIKSPATATMGDSAMDEPLTGTMPDAAEPVAPQPPVDDPSFDPVPDAPAVRTSPAPRSTPLASPRPSPTPKPAPKTVTKASPPPAPKPVERTRTSPPPAPKPAPQTAPAAAPTPKPAPPPAPKPVSTPSAPPPAPKGSKVMLSGSEAYSPPPAATPTPATPAPRTAPAAPTSGDIFWSGTLDKNQVVTVDFGAGAAAGGQPLPGKPVTLETFSPVVEITELPGPENGWKRFSFKANRNAKRSVTLNFHWSLK